MHFLSLHETAGASYHNAANYISYFERVFGKLLTLCGQLQSNNGVITHACA